MTSKILIIEDDVIMRDAISEWLAAADRDDLGARSQRIQPLGRRRHSGADDRDP